MNDLFLQLELWWLELKWWWRHRCVAKSTDWTCYATTKSDQGTIWYVFYHRGEFIIKMPLLSTKRQDMDSLVRTAFRWFNEWLFGDTAAKSVQQLAKLIAASLRMGTSKNLHLLGEDKLSDEVFAAYHQPSPTECNDDVAVARQ